MKRPLLPFLGALGEHPCQAPSPRGSQAVRPAWHDGAFLHFNSKEWCGALGWAAYVGIGHAFVVFYTVRRLVRTLRDVYTSSFIDEAIGANR